jgi:hypothetical protein
MIVHREEVEYLNDQYLDETDRSEQQVTKSAKTVFRSDSKVTYMTSRKFTGKRRDNGKRWFRWHNDESFGFRANKNGLILPYHVQKGKNRWVNGALSAPFNYLDGVGYFDTQPAVQNFRQAVAEEFGEISLKSLYPITELYDINTYDDIPKGLTRGFREKEFSDFVAATFGKTRMRKDLVKACAKTYPEVVALAADFRGMVPIDWIVNFLRLHEGMERQAPNGRWNLNLRPILRNLDVRSYRGLLNTPVWYRDWMELVDVLQARRSEYGRFRMPTGERARTWHELHDLCLVRHNYARGGFINGRNNVIGGHARITYEPPAPPANEPVKLVGPAKELHNMVFDDYKIVCATETDQLREWGKEMRNCIGGYTHQAKNGGSVFGAVYKAEKLIANFEIAKNYRKADATELESSWRVNQLLGKTNITLSDDVRQPIEKAMEAVGVEIPVGYWGDTRQAVVQNYNVNVDVIQANQIDINNLNPQGLDNQFADW